jgi:hypothetical protein
MTISSLTKAFFETYYNMRFHLGKLDIALLMESFVLKLKLRLETPWMKEANFGR